MCPKVFFIKDGDSGRGRGRGRQAVIPKHTFGQVETNFVSANESSPYYLRTNHSRLYK